MGDGAGSITTTTNGKTIVFVPCRCCRCFLRYVHEQGWRGMACPPTVGMPMRAMVDDIVIAAHGTHATEDHQLDTLARVPVRHQEAAGGL
jgi:hypothetical protein